METKDNWRQNNNGSENEMMQESQNRNFAQTDGFEQNPAVRGIKQNSKRGFAAMDPQKQKMIAQQGGRAAHQQGVAHRWTSEEAREAGRKGGQNGSKRNGTTDDR